MNESAPHGGWLQRMRHGLRKSTARLSTGIGDILTKRRLDQAALDDLEELLITADLGVATAALLTENLAKSRFGKTVTEDEIRTAMADDIEAILTPVAKPLVVDPAHHPHVILVVGVNGTGKTTTIGKLASRFRQQGHSVMLAAGDTFRAAAIEQLQIWGERTGSIVVANAAGTDPAALAYTAIERARATGTDILLLDTAGRLHNKAGLMDELQKINRVISKLDQSAPHDCLLVLDATTGQNAHAQVETFRKLAAVTGLVVTKLDGSARGGIIVALAKRFAVPIHAIGVGEGAEDLRPFEPREFARSLMGLNP